MNSVIIWTIVVLFGLGVILSMVLYLVANKFKVQEDPRIDEVEKVMPGANCGGCGFAGCRAFADAAVHAPNLDNNYCPVGGNEVMKKVAAILGYEIKDKAPQVAVVRCNGTCANRPVTNVYDGAPSCKVKAALYSGDTGCPFGCLGCGDCVNACVFGASQGGMIAQYLAIDHADLIEKLVIAVSAPKVNATVHSAVEVWIRLAKQKNHKQLMIDTAEKSYSEAYLKKYRKMYPVMGWIGRPKDYRRFLVNAGAILDFDCFESLTSIHCPTLIIGGEEDQIVGSRASYEMHEQIAGSQLYMYEKFGHAAYEEASDFNQRVFAFLSENR